MAYQHTFRRYELKYLITQSQKETILRHIAPYMHLDQYGRTTIQNIYFDTADYRLIRRSIEKPVYKEKLRVRRYGTEDTPVFVELKKKYRQVVYKRRVAMPEQAAMDWLVRGLQPFDDSQICRELAYVAGYYTGLRPTVYLCYDREAYFCESIPDFRVTFDDTITARVKDLSFAGGTGGHPILDSSRVLMELKCAGGLPLWMVELLSRERIYKTSFSKYGTAYQTLIFPNCKEEIFYGTTVQGHF